MSEEQKRDMTNMRLQQAHESLHEAKILMSQNSLRGVINRAYYAMFYAVMALTVLDQVSVSKHSGIIAFFDRDYVKKGVFEKKYSRILHLAFERRQVYDYGELLEIDHQIAEETISDAADFVNRIEDYVQTKLS